MAGLKVRSFFVVFVIGFFNGVQPIPMPHIGPGYEPIMGNLYLYAGFPSRDEALANNVPKNFEIPHTVEQWAVLSRAALLIIENRLISIGQLAKEIDDGLIKVHNLQPQGIQFLLNSCYYIGSHPKILNALAFIYAKKYPLDELEAVMPVKELVHFFYDLIHKKFKTIIELNIRRKKLGVQLDANDYELLLTTAGLARKKASVVNKFKVLDLSGLSLENLHILRSIPDDVIYTIRALDLSHNNLRQFDGDDLRRFPRLLNLILSHNRLESVKNVPRGLRVLRLDHNALSALPDALDISKMRELDIRGNVIQGVDFNKYASLNAGEEVNFLRH